MQRSYTQDYTRDIKTLEDLELQAKETEQHINTVKIMLSLIDSNLEQLKQGAVETQLQILSMRLSTKICEQIVQSNKKEIV